MKTTARVAKVSMFYRNDHFTVWNEASSPWCTVYSLTAYPRDTALVCVLVVMWDGTKTMLTAGRQLLSDLQKPHKILKILARQQRRIATTPRQLAA